MSLKFQFALLDKSSLGCFLDLYLRDLLDYQFACIHWMKLVLRIQVKNLVPAHS